MANLFGTTAATSFGATAAAVFLQPQAAGGGADDLKHLSVIDVELAAPARVAGVAAEDGDFIQAQTQVFAPLALVEMAAALASGEKTATRLTITRRSKVVAAAEFSDPLAAGTLTPIYEDAAGNKMVGAPAVIDVALIDGAANRSNLVEFPTYGAKLVSFRLDLTAGTGTIKLLAAGV